VRRMKLREGRVELRDSRPWASGACSPWPGLSMPAALPSARHRAESRYPGTTRLRRQAQTSMQAL